MGGFFSHSIFWFFLPLVWIISNNRSAATFLMNERNQTQQCPFTQFFYLREDGFHQTAQSCLPNRGAGECGGKVMKTAFFMYSGRNAKWNETLNLFFLGGSGDRKHCAHAHHSTCTPRLTHFTHDRNVYIKTRVYFQIHVMICCRLFLFHGERAAHLQA